MTNHSLDIYDTIGPEPSLSDYHDLRRWDRWFSWDRKRSRAAWARSTTDGGGAVRWTWWWRYNRAYWAKPAGIAVKQQVFRRQ